MTVNHDDAERLAREVLDLNPHAMFEECILARAYLDLRKRTDAASADEREELRALLNRWCHVFDIAMLKDEAEQVADAIIAAGWRKLNE